MNLVQYFWIIVSSSFDDCLFWKCMCVIFCIFKEIQLFDKTEFFAMFSLMGSGLDMALNAYTQGNYSLSP